MMTPKFYPSQKPRELVQLALNWLESGHNIVMLTLINIEGNAPYPVGSQMLVRDDGEFQGQLTGGCAEVSLVHQALAVIQSNENIIERYGAGSRFFDIQLPCGSGLDIEFDVQTSLCDYHAIDKELSQRNAFKFSEEKTYFPFDVIIFDPDIPDGAHSYYDKYSALILLFHDHSSELEILLNSVTSELFYIGALGSKRTHKSRLIELSERGVTSTQLRRINGPIGLDINSITPAQIAISILAQLISIMNCNES